MTPDWRPLRTELALWRRQGLRLPIWWRDDDATAPSPALETLTQMSERFGVPVHLAVIPQGATPALAAFVEARPALVPVVHGWAHQNHAPKGQKKSEFGTARRDAGAEAKAALERLRVLFGAALVPMFVPPWNRVTPEIYPDLVAAGYASLSTFQPRRSAVAYPGLRQLNTHIDPVDWHGTRSLRDPDQIISDMVRLLMDRREGRADNTEPLGVLSHHLIHNAEIWAFLEQLLTELFQGPVEIFRATSGEQTHA